ncbi:hypothetical protein I302_100933 [Kwoniella bestiolae CBS 10118]|uniref:Uncharacterized protein n=1 Tax=Kwoniella bestiolae CBS 10118 TaxID=1296100 RepID=A0A1B9G6J8_9TREE|nr:hypothetical protein I302_04309 [Kwoniella bestiolae CBS 10118]OCF26623.1 hypothetical protein I302_04309 [Kwoniella bestiolae CBS 10118]
MSSPPPTLPLPPCPNGLFTFDEGCVLVEDADEEIMDLYMSLASTSPEITKRDDDSGGLGFLNAKESMMEITIDLTPDSLSHGVGPGMDLDKKVKGKGKGKQSNRGVESVVVKIQQDLGMLKGQKGDTGSVLWRSSLHLSTQLLRQSIYPLSYPNPVFDSAILRGSSILELGSGTGLLAVLLCRLCRTYTSSDRLENLKLVKRNLELNGISTDTEVSPLGKERGPLKMSMNGKNRSYAADQRRPRVNLEEIDWVDVSQERKSHPERWTSTSISREGKETKYDLILAVDCIYNEYLVQPLIDTLAKYCQPGGRGVVWVVVELRSPDVLTLFLEKWLNDPSGPWTIVRLSEGMMGDWDGRKARWVGWVGWR